MSGVKGKSGGKRTGSGRPKKVAGASDQVRANWIEAAEKYAEKYGETVEYTVLKMISADDVQDTAKVAILKLYNDALLVKETNQSVNYQPEFKPLVRLPPLNPDPALEIVKGRKGEV